MNKTTEARLEMQLGDDAELLGMLHQEPASLPEGLTARAMEGWQRERRHRAHRWTFRLSRRKVVRRMRSQAMALAACAALGLFGAWSLLDRQPAQHSAEELMTPDALAELSAGLL